MNRPRGPHNLYARLTRTLAYLPSRSLSLSLALSLALRQAGVRIQIMLH